MNRLSPVPVFLGIAFFPHLPNGLLGDRIAIAFRFSHLELEHEHLAAVERHHVRPAPAGGILHPEVQADGAKAGVEEPRVPCLVAGRAVAALPLVGNPGEE